MREIYLTQNLTTQVDDDDYEYLSQFNWYAAKMGKFYAVRRGPNNTTLRMHAIILNPPDGMQVDHIDGNSLNNQRNNLRICTQKENARNRTKLEGTSSMYKGVHWREDIGKWQSYIYINRVKKILGNFMTQIEAAIYYDIAAKTYFGEFAKLNFPELTNEEEN